jgi:hypothetical protein
MLYLMEIGSLIDSRDITHMREALAVIGLKQC